MTEQMQEGSLSFASAARAFDGVVSRMVQEVNGVTLNVASEIDRFRSVRRRTFAILNELTAAQTTWSPDAKTWSVLQNADHLLRFEQIYQEQFRRLFAMAMAGKGRTLHIGLREIDTFLTIIPKEVAPLFEVPMRVFNYFVPAVFREVMVRYPVVSARNPAISEPRAGLTAAKLHEDLAASFAETERLFSAPLPPHVEELRIDHPVMGNNTVPQMLRIMIAHEERHQTQMSTLQANPKFPRV